MAPAPYAAFSACLRVRRRHFLLLVQPGPVREEFIKGLTAFWEFGKERALSPEVSLAFLGLDWHQRPNGDIALIQERFTKELLEKARDDTV